MVSIDLSARECDGQVVVALRGERDVADAASVAAREHQVIIDLAALEIIDFSAVAAVVRARKHARHARADLLLARPQQRALRVLALTRLIDVFSVHASVDEAASSAGRPRPAAAPAGRPTLAAT